MELKLTQENFSKALTAVGRVASAKSGLAILGNILLRTEGNRLLVAATNLEIASTFYIGAKVAKPGAVTVPARLLTEFVNSLPKGPVDIIVKNNHITIKSGNYESVIHGAMADEFPELPGIEEDSAIHYSIVTEDFKQAVGQTIITASSDTSRPVLTGVYWHSHEGQLYLAATDGYRLAERKLMATDSELAAIVPASTLQEVMRLLGEGLDTVEVLFDETQARFRVGEAEITSQLINGAYPDYRQLIPAESETVITVKADDFVRTVKIAGLFARESGGSITLTADSEKGNVSIHSIASELGENTSTVDATVTADGQVTLNSRYLSEALSVVDAREVMFRFSGKLGACILQSTEKDADYQHLIMPLKS